MIEGQRRPSEGQPIYIHYGCCQCCAGSTVGDSSVGLDSAIAAALGLAWLEQHCHEHVGQQFVLLRCSAEEPDLLQWR